MTLGVSGHRAVEAMGESRTNRFQLELFLEVGERPSPVGEHGICFFRILTLSHHTCATGLALETEYHLV